MVFGEAHSVKIVVLITVTVNFLINRVKVGGLVGQPQPFVIGISCATGPSILGPSFKLGVTVPSNDDFPSKRDYSSLTTTAIVLVGSGQFKVPTLMLTLLVMFSELCGCIRCPSSILYKVLLNIVYTIIIILIFGGANLSGELSPRGIGRN